MEVEDGYVLTASDYPSGTGMSSITWEQYTSPIHSDITINGSYSWGGMNADDNAELMESGEGELTDPVEGGAETASVATTSTTTTTTVTDYDYIYNGGQLTGEVITTTTDGTVTNTETLYYYYDASGTPVSVKYNDTLYFYVTNLQGDIVAIMNSSGTIVVEYTYDAWGYIRNTTGSLKDTLGKANAFRYRGYVYDRETGLYYLQSRYYNPGTGRFINADILVSTGQGLLGNNMLAYCGNNPVNRADPTGHAFMQMRFDPDGASGMLTPGPWGGGSGGVAYAASSFSGAISSIQNDLNELTYISDGDKTEAQIVDSYKITNPIAMYMFINEYRGDVILGSTTGAVVEWIAHDVAYGAGWVFNSVGFTGTGQALIEKGKDLDIGSTIYNDSHGVFSILMWGVYRIVAPFQSTIDIYIEIFE